MRNILWLCAMVVVANAGEVENPEEPPRRALPEETTRKPGFWRSIGRGLGHAARFVTPCRNCKRGSRQYQRLAGETRPSLDPPILHRPAPQMGAPSGPGYALAAEEPRPSEFTLEKDLEGYQQV